MNKENDRKKEEQGKAFTVKDRRFSARKEGEGEADSQPRAAAKEEEIGKEGIHDQGVPLPEITFMNFLLSLSTSALIQLGEIEDPHKQILVKNLPLAKQTIDLIAMLGEKTKGNLTPEEQRLMETILYDLRMRYLRMVG
jgi:hypothetical protein